MCASPAAPAGADARCRATVPYRRSRYRRSGTNRAVTDGETDDNAREENHMFGFGIIGTILLILLILWLLGVL